MKCGIYTRVSSAEQAKDDRVSLGFQESECRRYAEQHGHEIMGVFSDPGVSGGSRPGTGRGERAGLQRALDALRDGAIQVLIAYSVDRLSRDQNQMGFIAMSIAGFGGILDFATESFEASAIGTFMRSVSTFGAELEREKIKKRAKMGRFGRAAKGLTCASTPAFGYCRADDGGLAIDRREAGVVRRVFRDYTQNGLSLRSIALALTKEGIAMKRGITYDPVTGRGGWTAENVRRLLSREAYSGHSHQNVKHAIARGKYVANDRSEWLPQITPRIVPRQVWEEAVARIGSNRSWRGQAREDRGRFILQGIAVCGVCYKNMGATRGGSSHRRTRSYTCGGSIRNGLACRTPAWVRAERLEVPVWERIVQAVANPDLWIAGSAAAVAAEAALGGPDRMAADLRERIADEERGIARLRAALRSSKDTPRAAAGVMRDIEASEEQIDALRLQLAEVEGRVQDEAAQALARVEAEAFAKKIGPKLADATNAEQVEIVRMLVRRVYLEADGTIRIDAWLPSVAQAQMVAPNTIKVAKLTGVRP